MDDILGRREAARPRRVSAAAEFGASASLQDGEGTEVQSGRDPLLGLGRLGASGGRMERRNSGPQVVHQRHMPMEPLKFQRIPRKTKEKRALFHCVSTESREYEDMMTILTSSYIDTGSAACFTYCRPRLVYSELLEKEFVEKRKEMKADGRTDKELEESYCFLLADTDKVPCLCEKGLLVGQSWITVLGDPNKGVCLSRYSDLVHINALTPGFMGEIIIFKVMKGKVKSIYENMKNLLDPTPRFDSHISKNASKVTSLSSYRAFELTQQYFYEYSFDELRQRPRQVCPYAVISFQFKGKDSPLPGKPLAPIRMNSQSAEGSNERAQFTVWTGDLVKGDRVLFQISLRSFSPPFLPHRLPEKLEIGWLMRLDQVTKQLPPDLFSYNLYNNSKEVVKDGHCCSLLEVMDRSRSTTSLSRLLHELEIKRVVLVTPLTDKGFLFLLSSVQMATPPERGESWKRCLQALFVFPETRDVAKSTLRRACSSHEASDPLIFGGTVMPRLNQFIPALHHALVKARANPPAELSSGVERQAREYLIGQNDGQVRQYPMGEYESKLDEEGKLFPPPKHHRVNMDGYLHSYLYNPALYLLSVARARQMLMAHCGPEEPQEDRLRKTCGGQREPTGKDATSNTTDGQTNGQKMQQLVDLILTCKRNAENEVNREEETRAGVKAPGRKRKLEQETAERALKFLRASQEPGRHSKTPVEGNQVPASPGSLASVIGSVGLRDVDLREDGSELADKLVGLLTGLNQAARGMASQSACEVQEEGQRESCPFDRLATKLGLPTKCDIDLRKQEDLEEQMAGSVSSLEGFSPSSHSGEINHHGAAGRGGGGGGLGRRVEGYEEEEEDWEIPWVLIPITGLCSERYTQRDRNIPQDPRFQHLTTATSITTTTKAPRKSPTPSPEPSLPPSPLQCPSPEPSPPPSQCPSPDPSPPPSPSQCPSPEPSPPPSASQCPSPEPSPPVSPSQCPSPQPSPPPSPSQRQYAHLRHPRSRQQSLEPNELSPFNKDRSGAKEERLAPTASREFAGVSKDREEKPQGKEEKNEEPSISVSVKPSIRPAPGRRTNPSPPPAERKKEDAGVETEEVMVVQAELLEEDKELEKRQKRVKYKAVDGQQNEEEEEVMEVYAVASDEEQKRFSPSVHTPPSRPLRNVDSIVDKHLGDFSSDIQLLLQEESVQYSFPQSPHSTSNKETAALQHTPSHTPLSQFSQYVSFYNVCPPVQDYVSSLQDSISSMLTEFNDSWPSHRPATSCTNTDAVLANRVSDFVARIRAANVKTGRGGDELTAADASKVRRPHTITKQFPDGANRRNPPTSHVTLPATTSASGSVYKPTSPPNKSSQSHWKPQPSHNLEISRPVAQSSTARTVHCTTGVESGSSFAGVSGGVTLPGFSSVSKPLTEPPHPCEPLSTPASASVTGTGADPAPPTAALNSLISQLQPEVFSSLVKIIKDVKRNSLQFYLHSTGDQDQVYEDVREYLLKQGNVEQSPVAFVNQENPDNKLLVIIKNKDIAGHVHKIPELVSLKRHPAVVFVGIDTLDDIRNNSYNELFVSGGCIVSDELVVSPDFLTHDQLAALLMVLEQNSSPENVWRWKVHCKTQKKLKEQARFRRDAANLLDVLSAYQKRQIVEFLPYHECDTMNHEAPDHGCLMQLQARYTQYRHTVFLTGHNFNKFPAFSSSGIIVANIDEILHNFTRLVGCHDFKNKQPIIDDILAPKGLSRQSSEGSPSIFPENNSPLSSRDQPQHLLQQVVSGLSPLSHLSDQLVPDASCKEAGLHPSGPDYEILRLAISQLRAERQAQLQQQQHQQQHQQLDSQAELSINPLKSFPPKCTGSGHTTPPLGQRAPTEVAQHNPGESAVAATLELIHSELQLEEKREDGAEGWRRGGTGSRDHRDGTPGRVAGLQGAHRAPSNNDTSTFSSIQNAAAVTGPSHQANSSSDGKETADHQGEAAFPKAAKHGAAPSGTTAYPVESDRSRGTHSVQQQPVRGGGTPPGNITVGTTSSTNVTGRITMVTGQEDSPSPGVPHLQQPQQPQKHQQLNNQQPLQHRPSELRPPHLSLMQPPHLPPLHSQPLSHAPMLGPMGGMRGLLGPTGVWSGGLGPAGTTALVWGFQHAGGDFAGPSLMGGYHNLAGQDSNRYRGGQRGGGFNGM